MILKQFNRKILHQNINLKRYCTVAVRNEDEYTAVPNYPPILDLSPEKKLERKKDAEYEAIRDVKTVEEKQIKLNMPSYYGFTANFFNEDVIPYNNLSITKHVTRTHLIETDSLPDCYKAINVDEFINAIKPQIEEAILIEYDKLKALDQTAIEKSVLENQQSASIVQQINRILFNNLSRTHKHFLDTQIDLEPRVELFWVAGGMEPSEILRKIKKGCKWQKEQADDKTDRYMYYTGAPIMHLRHELPLSPIIAFEEATNPDFKVPHYEYAPNAARIFRKRVHAANIPGFWPGDRHTFGLLSYHQRGHLLNRMYEDPYDKTHALHRQGIFASFAWLCGQANHLGFTTYNDVTYPLVTQTVITNGKKWSFYTYQLNTMKMYGRHSVENPKSNVCWASGEQQLFNDVVDGKLIGFNDDVLKSLVKLYVNQPAVRLGINLRPYLGQQEKVSADYGDDDKRQWLEREYKFLVSNRPRLKLEYEVYHWEKIYKIDNQTRPFDRRSRPFQLFINPFKRRLDERQPFYIPRKQRPHLPRHKGRYHAEYFP